MSVALARASALCGACVALTLAPQPLRAQGAPAATIALQRFTVLDAKKIASVARGDAVSITLDAPEKTEIATLGVVRVDVPRAFYLDRVRHHTGFLSSGSKSLAGTFSEPARLEDVETLALDPSDAKTLEKCKPLSCDVKLPASEMAKFRTALAKSPAPAPLADSLMREWLVAYVNAYRADSSEETVVYDDTKHPVKSSDAFRALLAEPMIAGMNGEPFAAMLSTPRSARPADMVSRIAWTINRVPGLKPTLEVVERSMYSPAAHPDESFLTGKMLYASHYFESQLDFLTATDAPAASGKSTMYLVVLRRSKFDDLPSGGLFNIRGKAVKKLRDALRTTLVATRAELETAYGEQTAAPSHAP
ncbi:MAG: hypothetical protein ABIQ10_04640 [Gemmatimonadaceae bacterium]